MKNEFVYYTFFITLKTRSEYKSFVLHLMTIPVAPDIKSYFICTPLRSNKYLNKIIGVVCLFYNNVLEWIMFVNSDSYNPLWTANDGQENCQVFVSVSRSLVTRGFIFSVKHTIHYLLLSQIFTKLVNPIVVQL